ncbi:hypothetical protein DSO57_1029060 [Entomophthora muscae]|uniref:Uncharacterized protein n=1 Tax=Entomophthora muscae TaxID=34485 RepID=A0ACC2TZR4_9FUNG|nr:hypothetical protein DSO57_1029060 [Entomophthora muscae]
MDFELAQVRAFEDTFNREVQGFFFHFRKTLMKHFKSKKELFENYLNNVCCLGFEAILKDAYVKKHFIIFKGYLDYFERQWIGKKVTSWKGKSGAIAPWNYKSTCINGEMKTMSSLKLQDQIGANPKFNRFFQKLQEEQERTVSKFQDLAKQAAPKKKKSKEQNYQEDIQIFLWKQFYLGFKTMLKETRPKKGVQKVVKKKYMAAELKKYLEDVTTAIAGGFN